MLTVHVANHGRRPVSIRRVLVTTKDDVKKNHSYTYHFKLEGIDRLDVGQCLHRNIKCGESGLSWSSVADIKRLKIAVVDALDKQYRAPYRGHDD